MVRPRKDRDDDIMVAIDSGVVTVDGVPEPIHRGVTRARRGHQIVKLAPTLWKPLDVHYDIEKATAAPGEKRGE